jgi:hypothetical protein
LHMVGKFSTTWTIPPGDFFLYFVFEMIGSR